MKSNNKKLNGGYSKGILLVVLKILLVTSYFYSILCFFEVIPIINNRNVTILSVVIVIIIGIIFFSEYKKQGLSLALLSYLIATQFGMSTIYYLLGEEYLESYSSVTLRFLTSTQYPKAILLGIIAIISYALGVQIGTVFNKNTQIRVSNTNKNVNERNIVFISGCILLLIVLIYLTTYIVTGKINIGMSYSSYLNSGIVNSIYSWIVLIYSVGICFVVSSDYKFVSRIGVIIYLMAAIIFLSTGNRGEVLYSTLAAIGVEYYKNNKLKFKYVILVIAILFILIPFIKLNRHVGTTSMISFISVNFLDSFAEMGHQLRLSVLILEEFIYESREFLLGFSYYNPIINIIDNIVPWSIELNRPLYFNFEYAFNGLGFSQVAESYANFGVLGVVIYHFLIAYIIRCAEMRNIKGIDLAYWGSVTAILINSTRNRFAFVFGQILVVWCIKISIKFILNRKIIIRRR